MEVKSRWRKFGTGLVLLYGGGVVVFYVYTFVKWVTYQQAVG